MSNMSYCRFRNTLSDLRDCAENLLDELPAEEHNARANLIRLAIEIVENAGGEVDPDGLYQSLIARKKIEA